MKRLILALSLLAPFGLIACDNSPRPPGDTGVCYHYVQPKGQKAHFNVLARNVPNLETCAAQLEAMRLHFLGLGGDQTNLTGAYQTKFLFLEREGIFTADSLNGASYIALVRTGDGHLAPPGSAPQQ
ncbi:MAG: hypothetical protein M3N05_00530 [Pseudomonadota bacterium]|nr:hypothetical protein [Pseudomonadota bacterium]